MANIRPVAWLEQLLRTCILVPALLLPMVSSASEPKSESVTHAALPVGAKITEEQAKQVALQKIPGEVTDATIEKKLGKMVWVIEIVAQNGGVETDVLVDLVSGEVLGVER
jgi:uncharacterized membrane protein YkoI